MAESVKSAVVVSMKNMDSITRDKSSVMFYGMPESKQDTRKVKNVLKAMSVICEPTACMRLGKKADDVRSRPLKVIFSNTVDKNRVLGAAKSLKVHAIFKKVRVSKFLSHEEMDKLKSIRAQCKQLNDEANGSSKYIVINSRIMTKGIDEKLVPFVPRAPESLTVSSASNVEATTTFQPKNALGGSHVTSGFTQP